VLPLPTQEGLWAAPPHLAPARRRRCALAAILELPVERSVAKRPAGTSARSAAAVRLLRLDIGSANLLRPAPLAREPRAVAVCDGVRHPITARTRHVHARGVRVVAATWKGALATWLAAILHSLRKRSVATRPAGNFAS